VPEVDDDQLVALRELRAAFDPIEIVETVSNDLAGAQGELVEVARKMTDPRRMATEEHGEAHALLVKAVSDPDWQAARQALEELMRKLLVVHRLLEAEERLTSASRQPTRRNGCRCPSVPSGTGPTSAGGVPLGPPAGAARARLRAAARVTWSLVQPGSRARA
jgi:hypothetical protein